MVGWGIGVLLQPVSVLLQIVCFLAVLLVLNVFHALFGGQLDTSYKTTPTVSPGTNYVHNWENLTRRTSAPSGHPISAQR